MSITTRIKRHERLLEAMVDTVGVDMVEQRQRGVVDQGDLNEMTDRCLSCNEGNACEEWLEIHGAGTGQAPGFCKNRETFERMR